MNTVAIIPARGGSKRVPRKNIRDFCGRPMIAWPIAACLDSGLFDRIIVSTDDDDIAEVALNEGAEVPFRRPAELADDYASTVDVMAHAADVLDLPGETVLACVYATAPFLSAKDLGRAVEVLTDNDYVLGVCEYPYPIQRALIRDTDGSVRMVHPEHLLTRSQDLPARYHDTGQFYLARASVWRDRKPVFGPSSIGLILPRHRVRDIDTSEDWKEAEQMFKAMSGTERGDL